MPHMTLTVDGETLLEGAPDEWHRPTVEAVATALNPRSQPARQAPAWSGQPWVGPAYGTIADAVKRDRNVKVTVQTDGDDFTMSVKHG